MSKFNKKFVSLVSSLLALTSIAGSAKAMDPGNNPYQDFLAHDNDYNDAGGHTVMNALRATQTQFDDFVDNLNPDETNIFKDKAYYVANRVSNHPKTVAGVATASGLALAYKLGAFDSFLGRKRNRPDDRDNFDADDDDEEGTEDTEQQNY